MKMMSVRHYTLRTTLGHVIHFKPKVPTEVPQAVVHEALAVNILPVEQDSDEEHDAAPTKFTGYPQPLLDALVFKAIDVLMQENDVQTFDSGGRPKVSSINDIAGTTLNASQRNKYWNKYQELMSAGEELPYHKAADLVVEIQNLTTPNALKEYAGYVGLKPEDVDGHSVREAKKILIAAAMRL